MLCNQKRSAGTCEGWAGFGEEGFLHLGLVQPCATYSNRLCETALNAMLSATCSADRTNVCFGERCSFHCTLAEGLMALLGDIGRAYVHLTHYDCAKALQLFSNLPPHHYNTGWVLCQVRVTFPHCLPIGVV